MNVFNSARRFGALLVLVCFAVPVHSAPVVVDNPSTPLEGTVTASLTELFTLGGDSEADEEFFGVVRSVAVDDAGNSYLLDEQLSEVRVFDESGQYLMTFGREGDGPGEFRFARQIVRLPDDGVGVMHGRPARLTRFGFDGTIGDNVSLGGDERMGFIQDLVVSGGRFAMLRHAFSREENMVKIQKQLMTLKADGTTDHVYLEDSQVNPQRGPGISISIDGSFVSQWTLGPDGRMYVVQDGQKYSIDVYGPDGQLERVIRRDFEPVRRSKEDIERMKERSRETADRFGGSEIDEERIRYYDSISDLEVRPNGDLWVLTSEGRFGRNGDNTSLGTFDVFDSQGKFVRQVLVDRPFENGDDTYAFVGDRLYVFDEAMDALQAMGRGRGMVIMTDGDDDDAEPEPLSISCYRLSVE